MISDLINYKIKMIKKIMLYFGFDKLQTLKELYKFNGGLKNMLYSQWR